jgi:hypothetical protein
MDSFPDPHLVVSAALEINRSHGTMLAWQFLSQLGFTANEIFRILKDAPGPENFQNQPVAACRM